MRIDRIRHICFAVMVLSLLLVQAVVTPLLAQNHEGDLTLSNQPAVDAFNYTRVAGTLRIQGAGITSLSALRILEAIEGDLQIVSNPALTDLDGLSSLTSIGGDLIIYDNGALARMDGLSGLSTISGSRFGVVDNAVLRAVENLPKLTTVESLTIVRNPKLKHVDGLSSLSEIGDFLSLLENDSLTNLEGLASLKRVGGRLEIWENRSLRDCTCNLGYLLANGSIGGPTRISENETGCNSASEIESNPSCEIPVISGVEPGKTIRVRTIQPVRTNAASSFEVGSIQQGRVQAITGDTLILQVGESGFLGTGLDNVDSLWVLHRSNGRSALYGGIIGGASVGTIFAIGTLAECGERPSSDSCSMGKNAIAPATLVGAALGFLIGALIGPRSESWRLRYARGQAIATVGVRPAQLGIEGRIRLKL